jgi:hypothetical protein
METSSDPPLKTRENRGAIKNGQSRDTGNFGHTRHKTNKTKTKHTLKIWATRTNQQLGMNPGAREGQAVTVLC